MMKYDDFKTYLITFLWKAGDSALIASLDNLIKMADAELNRSLDLQRRQVTLRITPQTVDYALPNDFRTMIMLANNSIPKPANTIMAATTLADVYTRRAAGGNTAHQPVYAVDLADDVPFLRLVGPYATSTPGDFTLVYRTSIPDYKVEKYSWVADDFLDLYVYTVLAHTATFLREDERLPIWQASRDAALMSALEEDASRVAFGGSPLYMRPHHRVP